MTVSETIERVLKPIQQFTRGWMMAPSTVERGREIGLQTGNDFWICGRAGVLGECSAEVAQAGLAFIGLDGVRHSWNSLPTGLTHRSVAAAYAACCTDWGLKTLGEFDPDRLAVIDTLGRRIADAAPASLGLVFAGWRALPQPDDLLARVALTTQVLREMRGAAHINAVIASGITPLEAVLASPAVAPRTGAPWAEHRHWKGPFRDPAEVVQERLQAERLTSKIMEPYFGVLSEAELEQFGEVVETTRNAIDM